MSSIDRQRLWESLEALAQLTEPAQPWTRRSFTPRYVEGRNWIASRMENAGLRVTMDAGGNLVGRVEGTQSGLPPLVTGSHSDTVPSGGRYDGILGVLAGIEVAHSLRDDGIALRHPLEIVDFLAEEPNRFGVSCVGSRGWAGLLDEASLSSTDRAGQRLGDALEMLTGQPVPASALRAPDSIAAFLELHIEQGPVLEDLGKEIGVVSSIVGIRRLRVSVVGRPDHAGTTPMALRRDALLGAASIVGVVRQLCVEQALQGDYLVATVGQLNVRPNAINAVPGRVDLVVEVRSDSLARLQAYEVALRDAMSTLLDTMDLRHEVTRLAATEPAACAPHVQEAIRNAARELGYTSLSLPSGAGHDAAFVRYCGPMGMVFIPCAQGRSHCPEEAITQQQALDGTRVLREALLRLDAAGVGA